MPFYGLERPSKDRQVKYQQIKLFDQILFVLGVKCKLCASRY